MLEQLLHRRIVFVGGKGGVGKTTIAAALGLAAAQRGRSTLLVSTDPAHSLGDVFERRIGDRETEVLPRLHALEIDPDAAAQRYVDAVSATLRGLVHPELYPEVSRQMELARSAPGAVEAALLERIAELATADGAPARELLIFDTAPTGHTLRLLSLPEMIAAWTEGLLRSRERSEDLGRVAARLGSKAPDDGDLGLIGSGEEPRRDRDARIRTVLAARRDRFEGLRAILLDAAQTAYVLVLTPEKLPIQETSKAYAVLRRHRIPVAGLVINRLMPAADGVGFVAERRAQEADYLREIEREFPDLQQLRLPLLARDVRGLDSLAAIAARLAGSKSPD